MLDSISMVSPEAAAAMAAQGVANGLPGPTSSVDVCAACGRRALINSRTNATTRKMTDFFIDFHQETKLSLGARLSWPAEDEVVPETKLDLVQDANFGRTWLQGGRCLFSGAFHVAVKAL